MMSPDETGETSTQSVQRKKGKVYNNAELNSGKNVKECLGWHSERSAPRSPHSEDNARA